MSARGDDWPWATSTPAVSMPCVWSFSRYARPYESSPSQLTSATRCPKPASASAMAGAHPPNRPSGSTLPSSFDVRPGTGGLLSCQANVIAASPPTSTSNSVMGTVGTQPVDRGVEIDHLADVPFYVLEARCV